MTIVTSLAKYNLDTIADKSKFAIENFLLGLLITFSVLLLLSLVVKLVATVMGASVKEAKTDKKTSGERKPTPAEAPSPVAPTAPSTATEDSGEIIAAITAAISLMLEAEGKDPRGFRVVSFKRSKK